MKDEMYNVAKIIQYDGFLSSEEAQDYLQKKYGCKNSFIKKNVLRLKTYKFERIFIFAEQEAKDQKLGVSGQEKLQKFSKGVNILVQTLSAVDEELKGQIAEVKEIKHPERPMVDIQQMFKEAGKKNQGIQHLASSVRNQQVRNEEDEKKEETNKNYQHIISQNLYLLDHFLVNVVNEDELLDFDKEENKQEEKEKQDANGGFSKLKLELRFSNQLSSIPFTFVVEGQRDDFWSGVSKNFSKVNVKATDYNLLKVYLSDINQQQIFFDDQQAIGFFFADFYEFFLKKNAKENFIEWFEKSFKYLSGDNPLLLKKHKLPQKQEAQLIEQYKLQASDMGRKKNKKPPFNLMEFTQLKLMQVSEKYEDFKAKQQEEDVDEDMKEFINEKLKECVFQAAVFHQKNNMNQYKKLVFKRIKKQQTTDMKQQKEKTKEESIRKLDRFIKDKEVKLLAKDSNAGINPLVEILNLLTLQEIDIRLRRLNEVPLMRQRGKWKRGGKKEGARKRRGVYIMEPKLDLLGREKPKQKKPYKKRLRQKEEFKAQIYQSRMELEAMTSKNRQDAVSRGQLIFEQKLRMSMLKKKNTQKAQERLINKQKTKLATQKTNWIKPIEKKNIASLTAKGIGKKLMGGGGAQKIGAQKSANPLAGVMAAAMKQKQM